MRKFVCVLWAILAFSISSRADASTVVDIGTTSLVVPQNGTIELGGPIPAGAQGTFDIIGNPSFSGTGFAVLTRTAFIDGESYSILTGLGTCPVAFCGSFPYVTDNVFGSHPGPGGFSRFDLSSLDPALSISSNWTLQQLAPGSNIVIPADYQVEVSLSLPAGISAIPEPSTWAMLVLGFVGIGLMSYRRSHKALSPSEYAVDSRDLTTDFRVLRKLSREDLLCGHSTSGDPDWITEQHCLQPCTELPLFSHSCSCNPLFRHPRSVLNGNLRPTSRLRG